MTQIGEGVDVGMIDTDDGDCPFDHESPKPPTVSNKLIGNGTTLASRMKAGASTHLYAPLREDQAAIQNPRDIASHPFHQKAKVVSIVATDSASGEIHTHLYPVTCAAHHLIPAQESLQDSPLLAYMVKKGEGGDSAKRKVSGVFSDGLVWANVGYDVNGSENGVFLPGSYAVGGGRGGMGLWVENDDKPDLEEEDADDVADAASNQLTGTLNEISDTNRKWLYVSQAVRLAPGQFHDRHQDYSDFIAEILEKIFVNLEALRVTCIDEETCPDCKKRADDIKELGVPTPFGLVARLNGVSTRMTGKVNGAAWARNIYTSKWGQAYMKAELAKKKRKASDL
jgi:hypothetical protein